MGRCAGCRAEGFLRTHGVTDETMDSIRAILPEEAE